MTSRPVSTDKNSLVEIILKNNPKVYTSLHNGFVCKTPSVNELILLSIQCDLF